MLDHDLGSWYWCTYQGIGVITRQAEDVNRRGVVGDADAALGPVLCAVVGDDGGDGAPQHLAAFSCIITKLSTSLALPGNKTW